MDYQEMAKWLCRLSMNHIQEINLLGDQLIQKGEGAVLLCLLEQDQAVLPGQLKERTGLSTGRIANLLKVLEEKMLVTRCPDEGDRRRVLVCLTERGRDQAHKVFRESTARNEKLLRRLGPQDAENMLRILERCLLLMGEQGDAEA